MVAEIEGKAGGRNHHGGPAALLLNDAAGRAGKALCGQIFICLVEIVHIHTDDRHIPGNVSLCHIHMEAVCVLHGDIGDIFAVNIRVPVLCLPVMASLTRKHDRRG